MQLIFIFISYEVGIQYLFSFCLVSYPVNNNIF